MDMKTKSEDPDVYVKEMAGLITLAADIIQNNKPDLLDHVPQYLNRYGNRNISHDFLNINQSRQTTNAFTSEILGEIQLIDNWINTLMRYCIESETIDYKEDIPYWEDIPISALVYLHIVQGLSAADTAEILNVLGPFRFLNDAAKCALIPRLNLMGVGLHTWLYASQYTRKTRYAFYDVKRGIPNSQ
ncbi:hypothetical protein Presley_10 [Acinetobacter phage Presley]|uniref:Uncharacterized protein n=1 Tax=Acinetobacter phage Presley TaxID=1406780 RepID=U5PZL5_9CAUD|nr:hypothetical protein Presley_10 [Acinetobacter phage Presley]AGY48077.1 hypothetical protein Presley_10 [Acinetobacter phage Presley]